MNHDGVLYVYVNSCPHASYPLDLGDGDVTDDKGRVLVCHSHGARFRPESGECFWGPAAGMRLEALPFVIDGDEVVVTVEP